MVFEVTLPWLHRSCRYGATAAVFALSLIIPSMASAQDLTYTTVTRVEFGGTMGMMARMVPDMESETQQTVFLKGSQMRTDDGDTSTIFDVTEGRYTMVEHPSRTYFTTTLGQMQEQMEQTRERMGRESPMVGQGPPPGASFEFEVSMDRTGETRSFDGYTAEQVLLTMEMVPASPEAEEAAAAMGRTVLFTEMWLSSDFPGADAYRRAQEEMGEAFMAGGGGEMAGAMAQAMAGNPSFQEAMEKNMAEMKDMEGVPVRTTTHMVSVPAGMEFDAEAVLAAADQPLESVEMPSMADAAREAARGALGRRMGGLLGRRNQEEEEPREPEAPAAQTITMRSVSTLQDIRTESLSADLFQPPAGYEERQPEWLRG